MLVDVMVAVQIAPGEAGRGRRVWIGQREAGHLALDGRAPVDRRLRGRGGARHLGGHCRGADRLGHRGELKHGIGIDRTALVHAAHAEAVRVHGLAAKHHGHRHPGHAGAHHPLRDLRLEPGDGGLHAVGLGRRRVAAAAGGERGAQAGDAGNAHADGE